MTTLTKHFPVKVLLRFLFPKIAIVAGICLVVMKTDKLHAQCSLVCTDLIHVSLGIDGYSVITPNMLLNDTIDCTGPFQVDIFVASQSIGDTVTCDLLGRTLDARVTDLASGNFCPSRVHIEDKGGPVILCQDTIVPCGTPDDPDTLGYPVVMDNCDPDPDLFYSDSIADLTCTGGPYNAIIYRTWRARDNLNNLSAPCVQRIFFETPLLSDVVFPPNWDGIAAPFVDCSDGNIDPENTGKPMIDSIEIGMYCKFTLDYEDLRIDICDASYKILRKWTVLDCCSGIDTTGFQSIVVMDSSPPSLTCPDTLTFRTNNDACAASFVLPPFPVDDDCSLPVDIEITYPGGTLNTNGGVIFDMPQGINEMEVTATDACGNDTTCTVIVVVEDLDPPVAVCTEFLVVNINSSGIACVPATSFDAGSYDNCCLDSIGVRRMDDPDSIYMSNICFDCDDVGESVMVVVRFWDCFGNYNDCMVEVRPQDKIQPSITCPPDITILCTDDYQDTTLTGAPVVSDNCPIDTLTYSDDVNLNMCNTGFVERTWQVTDRAGFMAVCTQIITVIDTTPAVITFPPDSNLTCDVDPNNVDAGFPTVTDDCSADGYAVAVNDTIFSGNCFVEVQRTFTVLNWCTLEQTTHTQIIRIVDMNPPEWDQLPGELDTIVSCAGDAFRPIPTAEDACSDMVNISLVLDDSIPGSCRNDFTRIYGYIAEDNCGNVTDTFLITVVVSDTIAPIFQNVPRDTIIDCNASVPEPFVTARDNCPGVFIGFLEESLPVMCPELEKLRQTWIAEDFCGNADTAMRIITFIDTVPPTANPIPDSTYQCPEDVPLPSTAVVTGILDNCMSPVTVTLVQNDTVEHRCRDTLIRVYRIADECNNFRDIPQTYYLEDTIPPRIFCPEVEYDTAIASISCFVNIPDITAMAIDNCDDAFITITNDSPFAVDNGPNAGGNYPIGFHRITFIGQDECLNIDSCVVDFQVVDVLPPTHPCGSAGNIPLDMNGMAVRTPQQLLPEGPVFDFCSPPISFFADRDTFTCDDLGVDTVIITVVDSFGNASSCEVYWVITDPFNICPPGIPPPPRNFVAGHAMTMHGNLLGMVDVHLQYGDEERMDNTLRTGGFWFPNLLDSLPLLAGSNDFAEPVTVKLNKPDDPLNGVTTLDIALIGLHILQESPFTDPYQAIAADVNHSGTITTLDIVEIRRLILDLQSDFNNNRSWRFVPSGHNFQNIDEALSGNCPESMVLREMNDAYHDLQFTGIKTGDVNDSADPGNLTGDETEERYLRQPFTISFEDKIFRPGETGELRLRNISSDKPVGFQFTLQFDPEALEMTNISSLALNDLSENNFGFTELDKGLIRVSWNGIPGTGNDLFTIQFKALKQVMLSEAVSITDTPLKAEAYNSSLEILPVRLQPIHMQRDQQTFELYQNEPNPFSEVTEISFRFSEETTATLEILDISGKVVFSKTQKYGAGMQREQVKKTQLPRSGIYLYRLTSSEGILTRKMILVK